MVISMIRHGIRESCLVTKCPGTPITTTVQCPIVQWLQIYLCAMSRPIRVTVSPARSALGLNRSEQGKSQQLATMITKQLRKQSGFLWSPLLIQIITKAQLFCTNGILVLITMHPANQKSDVRNDVWKWRWEDYFPALTSPLGVIKPSDKTFLVNLTYVNKLINSSMQKKQVKGTVIIKQLSCAILYTIQNGQRIWPSCYTSN